MAKKSEVIAIDEKLVSDPVPLGQEPIPNPKKEKLVEVNLKHKHRINGVLFHGQRLLPESLAEDLLARDEVHKSNEKEGLSIYGKGKKG